MIEIPVTPADVGPTETIILTTRTRGWKRLTVEVKNTDGSQTLSVLVWRRASSDADFSPSNYGGLADIPPGETRCADLDVAGSGDTQLRGQASGIGLTAEVSGTLTGGWP